MPSRGGIRGPVGSISRGWPDYYWVQIPTVGADIFDRGYYCALYIRASIASQVVLTDKDLNTAEYT
jgi:hypothetical protein